MDVAHSAPGCAVGANALMVVGVPDAPPCHEAVISTAEYKGGPEVLLAGDPAHETLKTAAQTDSPIAARNRMSL